MHRLAERGDGMSYRVMRPEEWADPPQPVTREVLAVQPEGTPTGPPVLFVPGFGQGAWVFAEHWLEHTAGRGFAAYAMSLRGHGASGSAAKADLRAYVHDVTQVAAGLPRQAVLVGHGAGALVVAMALARYPVKAAALVAPVFGGPLAALTAFARNPFGVLPAVFGGRLRPRRKQLFSADLPAAEQQGYVARRGRASARAQWQLGQIRDPEEPVGAPPVLVLGSPDDGLVSRADLERVARRYEGAPLLFPGMGHDMMLDVRWAEPLDAILDWLEKTA
jgi:pimeloyl-ACP methyl ester carboxylesterase